MTPRLRRLAADLVGVTELANRLSTLQFRSYGDPPETYELLINTPGLAAGPDGEPTLRTVHRCSIYLHSEYPRRPPVITWLTPVLHPNILPPERNGAVCIGSWSAGESLADLVGRVVDMVGYRSFNTADALDKRAAKLVTERQLRRGEDLASWLSRDTARRTPDREPDDIQVLIKPWSG